MKNNKERSKKALILVGVVGVLELVMLATNIKELNLLKKMESGFDYSDEEVAFSDFLVQGVGALYTIAYLVSIITFIMWFRRAYFNLHTKSKNVSYSEGWASGAWFVPIINLFRPYQIMKELYSKTARIIAQNDEEVRFTNNLSFVGIWWFFWIVGNLLSNMEVRLLLNAETIDEFISCSYFSIVNAFISIPMALLAMKVIFDYSQMEEVLYKLSDDNKSRGNLNLDDGNVLDAFSH